MKKTIKLDGEDADQFELAFEAHMLSNKDILNQQRVATEKYRARILTVLKRHGLESLPDFNAQMTDPKTGGVPRPIVIAWDDGVDEKAALGTNAEKAVASGQNGA